MVHKSDLNWYVQDRLLNHYASISVKRSDLYACLRKKSHIPVTLYFTYLPRNTPEWSVTTLHHIFEMQRRRFAFRQSVQFF